MVAKPVNGMPACPTCGFGKKAAPPAQTYRPQEYAQDPYAASTPAHHVKPGGGKTRNFALVFLLGVITFGIYFVFWSYGTFKEVDEESGQEHGSGLWIGSLVLYFFFYIPGAILGMVYFFSELGKLQKARIAAGMTKGIGGGGFVGMYLLINFIGSYIVIALAGAVYAGTNSVPLAIVVGAFSLMAMIALPYFLVQRSINQYWLKVGA